MHLKILIMRFLKRPPPVYSRGMKDGSAWAQGDMAVNLNKDEVLAHSKQTLEKIPAKVVLKLIDSVKQDAFC